MNITLKRTPEQVELVKAMASRNRNVAYEAQVALAEFIGPVLAEVLNNAPTVSTLFKSLQFDADDNPSIPLDLYYNIADEDYVKVWSQSHAGGLPSNQVLPTASELKLATYSLDTAVDFDRRYAAKSRMDVVGKTFTRVAQEILLKQERTSATLLMTSLAGATIKSSPLGSNVQVFRSANDGQFLMDDVNNLFTLAKRINSSWIAGTPTTRTRGITDLVTSPEIVGAIRSQAYNPVNTRAAMGVAGAAENSNGLAAPEALREELYRGGGETSFMGLNILEFNEMGEDQKFNTLFDTAAGSTSYARFDGTDTAVFDADDEIVVGIDRSRDSLIRAVATDSESGSEFNLIADDQYSVRQNKIGYFGSVEEGRVVLDSRVLCGVVVDHG
jgi:hypothetical protein|tara:strand:+ start:2362 stop:3519 length:1158 start_codon:yes stop_codon:yes gene_type:complete